MKLNESSKFWIVLSSILIAALFGGILGNWVFIYLLDKYYGIPGGNYLAAPISSPVVVRDAKKVIVEQDNRIAQAIASADLGTMKIFKKGQTIYRAQDAIATAAIMTSDGWLITPNALTTDKNSGLSAYEAISSDRRRFDLERVVFDPLTGLTFIHLQRAQNLSVNGFVMNAEMSSGQTMIALGFDNGVEVGRLSRYSSRILASEGAPVELLASDISSSRPAFLYDAAGEMAGVVNGKKLLAIDSIQSSLEKLLTDGRISHPRLGIFYLELSHAYANSGQNGALIVSADAKVPAVVPGSPAEKAGLKAGDIITAVDGTALNQFTSLTSLLGEYSVGDSIVLSVTRAKETKALTVKLDEVLVK